jgi:hypothetical protein
MQNVWGSSRPSRPDGKKGNASNDFQGLLLIFK